MQPVFGGGSGDAFVAVYDMFGVPVMSSYLGGSGNEAQPIVAIEGDMVHVVGVTSSPDFPLLFPVQSTLF